QCPSGWVCPAGVCAVPQSCSGCVDPLGNCQSGTAASACGADGGLCKGCFVDDRCQSGQCVAAACLPSNCDAGCCSAAGCVDPPTDEQCGVLGRTCVACNGQVGETCQKGECVGPPCSPATCDGGCCAASGCVMPPNDFRCGVGGAS